MVNLASFWKTEAYGQTVLPDMSILIGQHSVKMPKMFYLICFWKPESCSVTRYVNFDSQRLVKIAKLKCDILDDFQTALPLTMFDNYLIRFLSI